MTNSQSWWPSASGGQSPFQLPSPGSSQGSGLFGLGLSHPSGMPSPPSVTPSQTPSMTPTPGVGGGSPNLVQSLLGRLFPNANSGQQQGGPLQDMLGRLFPNSPWGHQHPQASPQMPAPGGPVANATPGMNSGASILPFKQPVTPPPVGQSPANQVY